MNHGPTLAGELRRGVNAYNLSVGALSSVALGALVAWATSAGFLPDLTGHGPLRQALWAGAGAMVVVTALHTAAHAWFGWRFERGIRAHGAGNHREAVRLLRAVEGPHMDHYDPEGVALEALRASRRALEAGAGESTGSTPAG